MRDMYRILVIQLRELGDTVLLTPLLRQLRRLHPRATVDAVCQSANRPIIEHHPVIAETFELRRRAPVAEFLTLAMQLRRRRYDLIVDAQSLPKTALLTRLAGGRRRIGYLGRGVRNRLCYTHPYRRRRYDYSSCNKLLLLQDPRVDLADVQLDFHVSAADRRAAADFRGTFFQPPVAALYGLTRFEHRRWPAACMAELGDRLAQSGFQPFLVYGPGEETQARELASRMRCRPLVDYPMPSITQLKEILAGCELLVGNDGGPRHIANAAGIPTVAVMDAAAAVRWTPGGRTDQRVVRPRAAFDDGNVCGAQRNVDHLAEISVDAVCEQIDALARLGHIRQGIHPHTAHAARLLARAA